MNAGEAPDDFIDPGALGSFARSGLKEAFRVITRAQRLLPSEEGPPALTRPDRLE